MTSPKYQTDRTRRFRAKTLTAYEEEVLDNIENFGCHITHVKDPDQERPFFSYSAGLVETRGIPEVMTVGLSAEAAQVLLNDAADRLGDGVDLTKGRHPDLLGNVDCEFRPVDPKWTDHLMCTAVWFNEGSTFPVLQAVYPDLENRFPEDEGFNEYFAQPLLQPGPPMGVIEEDFWASNDPDSSLFDWKFPDGPHTGVYLSKTVNSGSEAVTYVSHDLEDGAWQFLGDSMSDSGGVLSCFHHTIDKDPSLKELADLPIGWYAERASPGEPWVRHQQESGESSQNE